MNDDDIERKLHRQMQEWYKAQRHGWEREVEANRAALSAWKSEHGTKLYAMHPAIQAEVEGTAWQRIKAGQDAAMTLADVRDAEARVASRMRVRLYGPMPDTADEGRRQHDDIRALLGLRPLPHATQAAA